ncbi:hypothetical protein ACT691_00710 [Vibrio metschnikovii]
MSNVRPSPIRSFLYIDGEDLSADWLSQALLLAEQIYHSPAA